MIVRRAGGIGDRIAALPQRRRALGEVERLFAIDHMAHLARVILVVARDAENARDGVSSLVADDRQRGNRSGFEQIGRHEDVAFSAFGDIGLFPRCAPGTQRTSASPRRFAKRAATNRKSESRLMYARTCSPTFSSSRAAKATMARSARRQTARA